MAGPRTIYLDNNASTRLCKEAWVAMKPWLRDHWGNPSSQHAAGRQARAAIDQARDDLCDLLGAVNRRIVFTSGATESNALAILGARRGGEAPRRIVTSAAEHPSVLMPGDVLKEGGATLTPIYPGPGVALSAADFEGLALGPGDLVSVHWVNSETGVVNDVAGIVALARSQGALTHVDASQALGKLPMDLGALNADFVTLSAHKAHGPKGVGLLVLSSGAQLNALQTGGGQERGHRGGTENVAGIVGFAAAVAAIRSAGNEAMARMAVLRDRLEQGLAAACTDFEIIAAHAPRAPNTSMVSWTTLGSETLLKRLDADGVAASAGSACSSALEASSHVLRSLGVSSSVAKGAVRFSLSRQTSEADIAIALRRTIRAVRDLTAM